MVKGGKGKLLFWAVVGGLLVGVGGEVRAGYAPSAQEVFVSNNYLQVRLQQHYFVRTSSGYDVFVGGRFTVDTMGGDPQTAADDNLPLLGDPIDPTAGARFTSYAVIRINDVDYEVNSIFAQMNNPAQDLTVRDATAGARDIDFAWRIPTNLQGINQVIDGRATGSNGGIPAGVREDILVEQKLQLVRDAVRIEFRLTNRTNQPADVGLRLFLDLTFGRNALDGQPFRVAGVDEPVVVETRFPDGITSSIPEEWRTFDNALQPAAILYALLDGADVKTAPETAGPPDQLILGPFRFMNGVTWDYVPLLNRLPSEDVAYSIRWEPQTLGINESRRYITYFGLGGATSDFNRPYIFAVGSPFSLGLQRGDDPNTAQTEPAAHIYRTPNPFVIEAYADNIGALPLDSVVFSISLPEGLELMPGQPRTQTVGAVPVDMEGKAQWQVRALPTQAPGPQTFVVSVGGLGLASKSLERTIEIPALPQLPLPALQRELDMISIPFTDTFSLDLQYLLGSLGTLGTGGAGVARWNPRENRYRFFPEAFITTVQPGEGFWLLNVDLNSVTLPATNSALPLDQGVSVRLDPGWNQIGCPYTVSTAWLDAEITTQEGVVYKLIEAANANLIRATLYEYNPEGWPPYQFSAEPGTLLRPWRGYWVRALQPLVLVIHPPRAIGPYSQPVFRSKPRSPVDGWQLALWAEAPNLKSNPLWIGACARAANGYDPLDIDQPPLPRWADFLELSLTHSDWGINNGEYLRDLRAPVVGVQTWAFTVRTTRPEGEVTLRWNGREVPPDLRLTLIDQESGERRVMPGPAGYTFRPGPSGVRHFLVRAERRGAERLQITNLWIRPLRAGMALAYTLSQPARVEVSITSLQGRLVRTLEKNRARGLGTHTAVWDGRDEQGRLVPAGQYLCQVVASTPEEKVRAVRTLVLTR
ncbi:MAG TPA: hypothetical protein EYP85_06160 [Armatimonadetes bacterium]|nr:hypothetical protein [Armatimonadota bacterium]